MSTTYEEIKNQPNAWRTTIAATRDQWQQMASSVTIEPHTHFLFVGSGSSLYISQIAAQVAQEVTGHVSIAVPSSDVFLSAASTVPRTAPVVAFVISRSGKTSEALIAADYLREHCANVTLVGVTCSTDSEIVRRTHSALVLPHAEERSVVMTQSFTSMLLALQVVAALIAGEEALVNELSQAPSELESRFTQYEAFARAIGEETQRRQFIFLGLGPNYGVAQEGTLKLKEMTQTVCEAYGPLEFRHGPISVVDTATTIVLIEGEREHSYLGALESELKQHGALVAAIAPYEPKDADHWLQLPTSARDAVRALLTVPALQLVAYRRALALNLDPDAPRNLTQVVELSA